MTAKEFAKLFYLEKNDMINNYFNNLDDTEVGLGIKDLNLDKQQIKKVKSIIDSVITDTMYTILLGLDGEASIGDNQESYEIYDETGNKISTPGDIEQYAYEYFQEEE